MNSDRCLICCHNNSQQASSVPHTISFTHVYLVLTSYFRIMAVELFWFTSVEKPQSEKLLLNTQTLRDNCVKGLERLRLCCCTTKQNMQDYHVWLDPFFCHWYTDIFRQTNFRECIWTSLFICQFSLKNTNILIFYRLQSLSAVKARSGYKHK